MCIGGWRDTCHRQHLDILVRWSGTVVTVRSDAVISFGVSSSVLNESSVAVGESFTSVTVMVTVEVFESAAPSLALKT